MRNRQTLNAILNHLKRIGRLFRSLRTVLKFAAANDNTCRHKGRFVGLGPRMARGQPGVRNGKSQRINLTRAARTAKSFEDVKEPESSEDDQGDP
jgi:hypothetical protein